MLTKVISDNMCFNIETYDNQSGVESVFFLVSDNYFKNYKYYQLSNSFYQDFNEFEFIIDKLKPGNYSYLFITRDFANNTELFYQDSFMFIIPKPMIDNMLNIF